MCQRIVSFKQYCSILITICHHISSALQLYGEAKDIEFYLYSVSFDREGSGRLMTLKFTSISFDREGIGEVI